MTTIMLILGGILLVAAVLFMLAIIAQGGDESDAPIRGSSPFLNGLVLVLMASMVYLATNET